MLEWNMSVVQSWVSTKEPPMRPMSARTTRSCPKSWTNTARNPGMQSTMSMHVYVSRTPSPSATGPQMIRMMMVKATDTMVVVDASDAEMPMPPQPMPMPSLKGEQTLQPLSFAMASPRISGKLVKHAVQMSPVGSSHLGFRSVAMRGGMSNHMKKQMKNANAENQKARMCGRSSEHRLMLVLRPLTYPSFSQSASDQIISASVWWKRWRLLWIRNPAPQGIRKEPG
mmetsp:Transcript_53127/g.125714  ORF Transcript_53127/g.125714 Transcript_53127/m.125714 type:complete len:227 (-) Transcript_53127:6-686(-)